MKIYLTRHSQTVWNTQKRLQGSQDSPLTNQGIENVKALKNYIQTHHIQFDYVYSSPIKRAYQTATTIFEDQEIILDDRLKEMNFGVCEGEKITDIFASQQSEMYDFLWNHPEKFTRLPDGESYEEIMQRAQSFIDDLLLLDADATVCIVTHGMCFIILLACMLHYNKSDLVKINQQVVEGCSLTLIEYTNDFYINYINKHDYLPYVTKNNVFNK